MTIQEAAQATAWSPRMLRYIERAGLLAPARTPSGYRIYDGEELERLRTLRRLLTTFDVELSDIAFAARMEADPALQQAVREWLEPVSNTAPNVKAAGPTDLERYRAEALLAAFG